MCVGVVFVSQKRLFGFLHKSRYHLKHIYLFLTATLSIMVLDMTLMDFLPPIYPEMQTQQVF